MLSTAREPREPAHSNPSRTALGKIERLLTIELDPQNRAVQVRGFSNRLALPDERKIIERWAKARGVMLRG
ncbi:hypothetical protein [Mesorhizobium erdmanii]|uniref:hypothetical protein n=1 Tax=Mesorhizobium erdmanii TaxID=1777866 RepID=UPI000420E3EB|nr:hypothetical protein [Mesorhizobium erdmanii]